MLEGAKSGLAFTLSPIWLLETCILSRLAGESGTTYRSELSLCQLKTFTHGIEVDSHQQHSRS